ncbi:MAG: ATP-binding protein [Alphaproteobacteria bacterium]|nr:ATP-binding protein [Alphaproteobacteria bacterium]
MYIRPVYQKIMGRLLEPRQFIQVLAGPRQVGKTTLASQVARSTSLETHYASADEPVLKDSSWIEQQWEIGRLRAKKAPQGALLILDEIQKIPHWSEIIKNLWDQDSFHQINFKVILLGSSGLLIQKGLTESLAGRFEVIPITHWSFAECKECFGWTVDQYIYFGGYPGAAPLIDDEKRWSRYIKDSLIETSISRDIMLMTRIHKPAILRRLFELGCAYSGQILSYQKTLGQLQDIGNIATVAHYLDLIASAGLLVGLSKFSHELVRQKASSPKFQVLNTGLITAQHASSFKQSQDNRELWGRLVESAVGAHLVNSTIGTKTNISYWREGNKEVDFIMSNGDTVIPIEVKSSQKRTALPGIELFSKKFHATKKLLVGGQGISIEEFLLRPAEYWL